jgi:high-affinity nickel-transport protein
MSAPPTTLLSTHNHDEETPKSSTFSILSKRAFEYHSRVPYISKLPFPAIAIIVALIAVNLVVWAAVGVVLVCHTPEVLSTKD